MGPIDSVRKKLGVLYNKTIWYEVDVLEIRELEAELARLKRERRRVDIRSYVYWALLLFFGLQGFALSVVGLYIALTQ